jgi:sodium/potassium-transporting ATPase subunit alpha
VSSLVLNGFLSDNGSEVADLEYHKLSVEQIFRTFSTSSSQGLSHAEVVDRQKKYGKNVLSPPPSRWFVKIIKYLFGGFGSVLFIASILVFISWKPLGEPPAVANLALGIVLALVFTIQAMVGSKSIDTLSS